MEIRRHRSRATARRRHPAQSRARTLAVMAVTALIIVAVAYVVNQPTATAGGVTSVTLTGAAAGAGADRRPAGARLRGDDRGRPAVRLSDFRGKPVWLTFGASWCQPCRAETPDISAVYEQPRRAAWSSSRSSSPRTRPRSATTPTGSGLTYRKVADPDTDDRLPRTASSASRRTSSSTRRASCAR